MARWLVDRRDIALYYEFSIVGRKKINRQCNNRNKYSGPVLKHGWYLIVLSGTLSGNLRSDCASNRPVGQNYCPMTGARVE